MATLHAVTDELAMHGRPGSTLMRRLLAERDASYVAPESGLEARFLSILKAGGLALPERQRNLGGEEWVGRVDFLYPQRRLVIEVDSDLHHTTVLDRGADARRDQALREAGYDVVRFREDQVWHRPREVLAALRAA